MPAQTTKLSNPSRAVFRKYIAIYYVSISRKTASVFRTCYIKTGQGFTEILVVQRPHLWVLLLLIWVFGCNTPPSFTPNLPPTAQTPTVPLWLGVDDSAIVFAEIIAPPTYQPPNVRIQFITNSLSPLTTDLEDGLIDAMLVHRVPVGNYWFNPVAVDGLVIVVHPSNPITNLSLAQLQGIFAGTIHNWEDVGGKGGEIMLFGRGKDAGIQLEFLERVMGEKRPSINTRILPTDQQLQAAIANQPSAIGFSMMGNVDRSVKMLLIAGIPPTPTTTANQSYPLTYPLYIVTLTEPQRELRSMIAWLQSSNGQSIIASNYGRVD